MDTNKKELKKVNNNPLTLQEIENTIPELIKDFCTINKIEDLKKESNNIFMSLLQEINKQLIAPNKKTLITVDHGTNKQTDYNKLYKLLELFINLCMSYDATVTVLGFSLFSGVERNTLYEMQYNTTPKTIYNNITKETHTPSPHDKTGANIFQKLRDYEELTTLNCRKYNDLRIIARLNRITGGAYRDYTQVDTGQTRQTATAESIADKYGNGENTAFLPVDEE